MFCLPSKGKLIVDSWLPSVTPDPDWFMNIRSNFGLSFGLVESKIWDLVKVHSPSSLLKRNVLKMSCSYMVTSKTSVLVKPFMITRSGHEAGLFRSARCIANISHYDMNEAFCQLGQQSKIRGWGQDTQVLVSRGRWQLS